MRKFITLEEHFTSPKVSQHDGIEDESTQWGPILGPKLTSLGASRLSSMDESGVMMQVVSYGVASSLLSPGACAMANDELHEAITANPQRYAGFATLPMKDPVAAASELRRCIETLGFAGALIDSHADGRFYDDASYRAFWRLAEQLDVSIYLHPTYPSEGMKTAMFEGNYPALVSEALGAYGFGWHFTASLQFLRLYCTGLFEEFPKLKIILGHMGEMLPFQLERTCKVTDRLHLSRSLKTVWNQNVWITTSGMFSLAPMACVIRTTDIDRIMFSVDYPFSENATGAKFFGEMEQSGLLSEDLNKVAFENALNLLKLKS